ncbi:MAG: phosphopantetheine adenylyltransferase [Candidatus Bathyarchaeia archaeon]
MVEISMDPSDKRKTDPQFNVVAVGGTFDELHKGHRALLMKAFESGDSVWIGLCTDEFAKKIRKNHEIAPYDVRLKELRRFLKDMRVLHRAKIIPLSDAFGPSVTSEAIKSIVVSRETEPRACELNTIRKRNGLPPLDVIVIDMVLAQNHIPISTTRIRHGEIDREGRLLKKA